MRRASTHTTRTPLSVGLADLTRERAEARAKVRRKRPPRIVLVVACSQRKRVAPPPELRLSSIQAPPEIRAAEWVRRIREIESARHRAHDLYLGDHWSSVCDAFRFAQQYSSRAELWIISAGYGLIPSSTLIKSYGATFATRAADSVWRGHADGDRRSCLRSWWQALDHERALADLLPSSDNGAVVIAAGAAYIDAIDADLAEALERDGTGDRVAVISAGSRMNEAFLSANGGLRATVGGTDSALNARLLAILARDAPEHGFSRARMEATVMRMIRGAPSSTRRAGTPKTDEEVARQIKALRRRFTGISRTGALRELRKKGIACEQARFAMIWTGVVSGDSVAAKDAVARLL
jgi:hypothetical protein